MKTIRKQIEIRTAEIQSQIEQSRTLFREYENRLGIDLRFQNFEAGLAELPGKYAKSKGGGFFWLT